MLDIQIFRAEFGRLAALFGASPNIAPIYYEVLQHLSDEIWQKLCANAIATQEWMPKPVWFLTQAADLMEHEAERFRAQRALAPAPERYVAFSDLSPAEQERVHATLKTARPSAKMGHARTGFGRMAQLVEQNLKLQNPETAEAAIEWAHQQSWVAVEYEGDRPISLAPKLREAPG
jgi:hypothetical protein